MGVSPSHIHLQLIYDCILNHDKLPGLRIAPPEAPVTGYMFGKGVYFADMFSKSANYCCANHLSTSGVLLLCEVVLNSVINANSIMGNG